MPVEAPQTVMVPVEQLRQMEANAAQVQQLMAQRELEATSANIRAQAAAGQVETLARSHRQEIEQERARAADIAKRAELTQSLSQHALVPGAISQLTQLWSGSLHADPNATGFAVRTAGYQDVHTFVSDQLQRPEYAHYKAGGSQAAAQAANASNPAAPAPAEQPQPKSYGEAIVLRAAAERAAREAAKTGHTIAWPAVGLGLGKGAGTTSLAELARLLTGRPAR